MCPSSLLRAVPGMPIVASIAPAVSLVFKMAFLHARAGRLIIVRLAARNFVQ